MSETVTYGQKATVVLVGTVLAVLVVLASAVSAVVHAIEAGSRDVP